MLAKILGLGKFKGEMQKLPLASIVLVGELPFNTLPDMSDSVKLNKPPHVLSFSRLFKRFMTRAEAFTYIVHATEQIWHIQVAGRR